MLDVVSPPARRTKQATWLDPRLLGGLLLIVVSLVIGARVVAAADKTIDVSAAARDLPSGHIIVAGDIRTVRVRLASPANYVSGAETVVGRVVARPLSTGELIPVTAVVAVAPTPFRDVTVTVKADHVAGNIIATSKVDVIATGTSATGVRSTWVVAKALEVVSRPKAGGGFAATDAGIVLRVPTDLVLPLTAAMRAAEIDVVRVPQLGETGDIGDQLAHPSPAPAAAASAPAQSSAASSISPAPSSP